MTTAAGEKTAPTCKLLTSLHITEFMFASETGSINAHIVGLNVHHIRLPIYWLVPLVSKSPLLHAAGGHLLL